MDLDAVEGDQQAPVEAQEGVEAGVLAEGVETQGEEVGEEVGARPSSRLRM
jgi:hypothetical protein